MEKTKEVDILDLLIVLAKHKKFIFWTTLIACIFAVIYSLLVPQYWVSVATILPAQDQHSSFSLGSSSSLLGLGSSLLGNSANINGLELITIMQSRTFSEDVVKQFNLINYFEINDPDTLVSRELALKAFRENVRKIGMDEDTGLISISIETTDKYLSTNIANYH
nr:Wzz/FepE/Etk N-terminal domain-containing protein [Candidatus Cloacimonadota bacterium]